MAGRLQLWRPSQSFPPSHTGCFSTATDRFGPVRVVKPDLVFEIAFEGIQPSPRHKAGIALRFPRIARWREDKPPAEADTLASVRALLEQHS